MAVHRGIGEVILYARRGDGPPGAGNYTFTALATTEAQIQHNPRTVEAVIRAVVLARCWWLSCWWLLVLEDLHDADRDTLDLLLHLARTLADARLLVVGTYRDVEVDRVHPLSAALADLHRTGNFLRIGLRGLSVDEVQRMYISLGG